MRICLLALVVFSAFSDTSEGSTLRVERDTCDELHEASQKCTEKAYKDFGEAIAAGDDGRPDWYARKACNYVTAAVEECVNTLIGECLTEEEVNTQKDRQIVSVLKGLSSNEEWDSEKCPPVKAHLERTNPVEIEEGGATETKPEESNAENIENTENTESIENTENTEHTENIENTENTESTESTENTENNENTESTENNENGENTTPMSGSTIATASLSVVLVLYFVCFA